MGKVNSFVCLCGSVKPLRMCIISEKARKPNCDCHYTYEEWFEVRKKYSLVNGKWRKNGFENAIREMKKGEN